MSVAKPLLALLAALLVAAPTASAYVQPVFYFLKDAPGSVNDQLPPSPVPLPLPVPIPIPTIDPNAGVLDPYDRTAMNAPNTTTSSARYVTVGTDALLPIQFLTPPGVEHPDRIKGPLFIGLWTGESSVLNGNLTVTLYEVPAGEAAPIPLANASVVLDLNQSTMPSDPTVFIPENQTDPQAILFYELAMLYPMLIHPPALFILGPVDFAFAPDSQFAIGFRLDPGSSQAPLATGAHTTILYDGLTTPSFVYVPWYTPDPPRPTYAPRPGSTFSYSRTWSGYSGGGVPTGDTVIVDDDGKDTPGFGLGIAAAALVAAAYAARYGRRSR